MNRTTLRDLLGRMFGDGVQGNTDSLTWNTNMYKINSTYTYGVISQNVQLLHQLTDHNLLRNKGKIKHHPGEQINSKVLLRCTQTCCTHSDSLCLTVDLQRTEPFWEIELLEVDCRWASLPLLNSKYGFHRNRNSNSTSASLTVSPCCHLCLSDCCYLELQDPKLQQLILIFDILNVISQPQTFTFHLLHLRMIRNVQSQTRHVIIFRFHFKIRLSLHTV